MNKKMEFSKKLAIFLGIVTVVVIAISAILSLLGKEPISDVAVAVISTCGGYLCTYGLKSAFEKNSRNKYGVDENGIPFDADIETDINIER